MSILKENVYGIVKRFKFVECIINKMITSLNSQEESVKILDFGCGTGELLTIPLAKLFRDKAIFFAYDTDELSLSFLKSECKKIALGNVFVIDRLIDLMENRFHLIIASEVVEHVAEPKEFLNLLSQLLKPHGKIILTLPNGYGLFELGSLLGNIFGLLRIKPFMKKIRDFVLLKSKKSRYVAARDTLAICPHINFFTYRLIMNLLSDVGLNIEKYEGRCFICGSVFDRFINKNDKILIINNLLGSRLPPAWVSGWMFVVNCDHKTKKSNKMQIYFFHKWYTKLKIYVNLKRTGLL